MFLLRLPVCTATAAAEALVNPLVGAGTGAVHIQVNLNLGRELTREFGHLRRRRSWTDEMLDRGQRLCIKVNLQWLCFGCHSNLRV